MGRFATDALALTCIVVSGAAGTAITLAALSGRPHGPDPVHASAVTAVTLDRTTCAHVDGPHVVVGRSGVEIRTDARATEHGPRVEVRSDGVRAGATVMIGSSACAALDAESVERLRLRLEEARASVETGRERLERSEVLRIRAEKARIGADREALDRLRRELLEDAERLRGSGGG